MELRNRGEEVARVLKMRTERMIQHQAIPTPEDKNRLTLPERNADNGDPTSSNLARRDDIDDRLGASHVALVCERPASALKLRVSRKGAGSFIHPATRRGVVMQPEQFHQVFSDLLLITGDKQSQGGPSFVLTELN